MSGNSETLNPYESGVRMLASRFLWDIQPESWRSRGIIKQWKNRYLGEKAVIVCNGPSLLETPLDMLDGIFTFGLNKINLLFDKSAFRPSCIVAVNPFVLEQNAQFYNETEIPLFLNKSATKHVRRRPNISYLHMYPSLGFARDCSGSVCVGYTVTFVAMQFAYHMGFSKVALVGCDHSFATKGPADKTVTSKETDPNHFDPNYFAGGVQWQLPDLEGSEKAYALARDINDAVGRKMYNCTVGGKLETFERMDLEEFISL
ncbi:MAG: 6-hydroxymethylpterin diphosphokinase MptE-like protein [Chloroflexota bacterium]